MSEKLTAEANRQLAAKDIVIKELEEKIESIEYEWKEHSCEC